MATATAGKFSVKCRRGDVIAWAQLHDYTSIDGRVSKPERVYYIGLVESVARDGIVKTANTGMGVSKVEHDLDSAAVRKDMIDRDKAWAWLSSDANYPRRGSTPLRSMDDVRAVVRQWFRD
jgi:hypothetical protein